MNISLVVAMSENHVIGNNSGGIPWHLPSDIKRFRGLVKGKYLLIGRKTFQEMDGWFNDHFPIVITSNPSNIYDKITSFNSVNKGMLYAKSKGVKDLMVCGGKNIYEETIKYAKKMYITVVKTTIVNSDVKFPNFSYRNWKIIKEEEYKSNKDNCYDMTYLYLERVSSTLKFN